MRSAAPRPLSAIVTWEALDNTKALYPDVQVEDELFVDAGRDVMTGVQYRGRQPISG